MSAIFQFVVRHGYCVLFGALFVHQIGLPIPGPLFLLSAGALAAAGRLNLAVVVGLTITACVLADWVWYEAGRHKGDRVLHFLHQFTRDPQKHDRRAKETFARYGLALLLVAKFVPGLDAVAPPLAGTSRTNRIHFLAFDAAGAGLYACAYGALGYIFSHDLNRAAVYVARAGRFFAGLVMAGILAYAMSRLAQRIWFARKSRKAQSALANSIGFAEPPNTTCGVIVGELNGE